MNNEFENIENSAPLDNEAEGTEYFTDEASPCENTDTTKPVACETPIAAISEEDTANTQTEIEETHTVSESAVNPASASDAETSGVSQNYVPKNIPQSNATAEPSPVHSIPVNPTTQNYSQPSVNSPYYQAPYGYNGAYPPVRNQAMPPYNPYNPYQAPPAYNNAPMESAHSKGSRALVVVLWVLVALFALGFFALCSYVAYRTPVTSVEKATAPTLFTEKKDDDHVLPTRPEEDQTKPQSDIVEGGVIPNNDKNDYSDYSSITLLSPPADKDNASKYTTQFAYDKISDSTVGIVCYRGNVSDDARPASQGTGIIITKDGYIATNSHVIGDSRTLYNVRVVLNDGTTYEAKTIGYDSRTDLAVLKVSAKNLTPATFCDSDKTEIGDDVIAVGNPGGMDFQNSLTKGIISAKDRELSLAAQVSYIQTDAAINPGNSGGPLCNMYGQVIGINTAKISDSSFEGMGFAIPSQTAKKVIDDLIHQGYVGGRVRLGISGQPVTEAMKQYYGLPYGILIGEIIKGSPCDGSGLEMNDVMTAIDSEEVKTFRDVYAILEKHSAGDKVKLSVYRSDTDEEFEIEVILEADEGQTQQ